MEILILKERKRINNEQYLDRQLHDDDNVVELYQNMESGYLRYNPINKTKQKKLTDRLKEFLNKHHKRTLSQEKEEMRELTDVKIRYLFFPIIS